MCWVFYCVAGRGSLLWPVHSLGKTLLIFAMLHFVLQRQMCLLLEVSIVFLLLHSSPLWRKGHLYWVLVLEGLIGVHRTVQLQLLQHYLSRHRLGLLWYWLICLETEIILSFLRLHPSIAFWTLFLDWKRSVSIPIPKKGNAKNVQTTAQLPSCHTLAKKCSKFSKSGFNSMWIVNFQMFKLYLEKAEEPDIKLSISIGLSKKQEGSRKISTSALLTMWKLLTVWITAKSGKFFSSVQFSHSVLSDSLRPHGLQHARLPCPSPTARAYWNSCS